MSETPRDQRGLWSEVSARIEELGEVLRGHLSADAARTPTDPTARPSGSRPGPGSATGPDEAPWADATAADADSGASGGDAWGDATRSADNRPDWARPTGAAPAPAAGAPSGTAPDESWSAPVVGEAPEEPVSSGPGASAGDTSAGSTEDAGEAAGSRASAGGRDGGSGPAGSARWVGSWRWGNSEWHTDSARPGWSGRTTRTTGPDWDSTRESVREMRESAQRFATQAADAARDPEVRDSAQRAVRSVGDAIATTAQDLATEIRERMRNPRWSDTSQRRPAERPPVTRADDDPPGP